METILILIIIYFLFANIMQYRVMKKNTEYFKESINNYKGICESQGKYIRRLEEKLRQNR